MKNIIDFANSTIDACVKCDYRPKCQWFGIVAENVVLDDITPEEYASLTYEEIATKIHANAGNPVCGEQKSLDEILETIESMLEHATIPNFSQELITLLNKMSRLEKRLKRLPEDCRDVFDSVIRAIVERCLSAIDYYFLDSGIDVYPLIQNIHADYRRTKMLHQYYLEGVVNVLLAKAKKLTLEQIVSWKDPLWQLRGGDIMPSVDLNTLDLGDFEDTTVPPEAYEPVDERDDNHFVAESPVLMATIKTINPHPVTRSFIKYITSPEVTNYVKAFSMSFGFDASPARSINDFFDPEFISKNITPRMDFEFENMSGVYKEITQEVRQRKQDEGQLHIYICSLFSEVNYIGLLLFPRYNDPGQQKRYMLFDMIDVFYDHSRKDFSNAWAGAMSNTEKKYSINDKEFFSELVEAVGDFLLTNSVPEHDRSMTGVAELRKLYRHFIAAIEAALLINKVEHNCLYYGLDVGACYTRNIPYEFIPGLTGLSQHAIENLSNNLGHNNVRPGELSFFKSTYPDLEEEFCDNSQVDAPSKPDVGDEPHNFKSTLPADISAVEEVKMRFSGKAAHYPISALLIKAGYSLYTVWVPEELESNYYEEWADEHSEEWDRYMFDRWEDLREEISSGIKARVKDSLSLKKYVCGLLTPFDYYGYYDRFRFDTKEFAEPLELVSCFVESAIFSSKEFVKSWKEMVIKLHQDDETENYSFDDYRLELWKRSGNMKPDNRDYPESEDWEAFYNRESFPSKYCGLIEGCLLENGAPLELMDYQDMCGVGLVDKVESDDIIHIMGWTEELLYSYNPKRVEHSEHCFPIQKKNSDASQTGALSTEEDDTFVFPAEYERAKLYLDVLKENGYLDDHYKWANKEGSLNYHAAWASKIISYNCNPPGTTKVARITHEKIGNLIGIPNLGTYVTDAKNKLAVTGLIERLFKEKGLSTQLP